MSAKSKILSRTVRQVNIIKHLNEDFPPFFASLKNGKRKGALAVDAYRDEMIRWVEEKTDDGDEMIRWVEEKTDDGKSRWFMETGPARPWRNIKSSRPQTGDDIKFRSIDTSTPIRGAEATVETGNK